MNRLRHALAAGAIAALAAVAAGEEAQTNTSLRLAVELVDGSRLLGRPAVTSAPVRTAYARMDISLALVAAITMAGDHEKATVDLQNGVYRIFDGPYGIGSGVSLYLMPEGLSFGVGFGGQGRGASLPAAELTNREWIHLAGAWDRQGLDGSSETLRLYVNGKKVAAAKEKDWGTNAAGQADIAGGNDGRCAGKFFVDNLKIWNCAKTDFSDRDRE